MVVEGKAGVVFEDEQADGCWFLRADAVAYLDRYNGPAFDVIFADPPYDLEALPRLPDLAVHCRIKSHRSSVASSVRLPAWTATVTSTSSKMRSARSTMSRWP